MLFEGALISGGIMVSYWINYGFWFVTQYGSFQWRFPIAFQAVFGIMLIIGVLLYPESPRWLVKKGKYEAATTIMAVLEDKPEDDPDLLGDIEEMKRVNAITAEKLTPKELFSNGKEMNLWRLSVACLSQAFQQLGGLNLVTYYATSVFEDSLGFDQELSRLMTGCLGTEFFIASTVALFVVDRVGRRKLMLWGAVGMGTCLLIVGACLSQSTTGYKAPAYAATVFIFVSHPTSPFSHSSIRSNTPFQRSTTPASALAGSVLLGSTQPKSLPSESELKQTVSLLAPTGSSTTVRPISSSNPSTPRNFH